ncbi:MAG: hypothetical protein ACW98X_04400 [Promethearchaeota archaeon]|jgi:hypothetical protein
MSYFKRNPWITPIIGGLVALISLFTPVTTWSSLGRFAFQWMFQLGLELEPSIVIGLWRWDPLLLSMSIILSIINLASTIIIIISTIIYKRTSRDYHNLKKIWLLFAIIIIFSTLTWIIKMEIFYNNWGGSHWQAYNPNFGVIGPFIGSAVIIIGVYLARDS